MTETKIPIWFIKKYGSGYKFYSLKGVYDPSIARWKGDKAREGAFDFKRWQTQVNRLKPVIRKFGTKYVVYIDAFFKTKTAAEKYARKIFPGPLEYYK